MNGSLYMYMEAPLYTSPTIPLSMTVSVQELSFEHLEKLKQFYELRLPWQRGTVS